MKHHSDEANLMGQVAGIITVLSAVVQTLPPTARKRLEKQLHTQFESLLASMRRSEENNKENGFEGATWVRDLFLKKIAAADKHPKNRKPPLLTVDSVDFPL